MLIPAQQILAIAPVSPLGPLKKYLSLSPSLKRDGRHNSKRLLSFAFLPRIRRFSFSADTSVA